MITITPEMLQAGFDRFLQWEESDEWDTKKFIKELYLTMRQLEKPQPPDQLETERQS